MGQCVYVYYVYVYFVYTVNPQIKTGMQLEAGLQIVAGCVVHTDK